MKKIVAVTAGVWILCLLSGCFLVPIALVGGGVIGGLAISEDTVQTEFDKGYDQVWGASVEALEKVGAVETKDKEIGRIEGHARKSKVTIKLEQVTASTVRIQVKARKTVGVLPDIKTAQRIAYRINTSLKEAGDVQTSKAGK